jgi:hypothetical protein
MQRLALSFLPDQEKQHTMLEDQRARYDGARLQYNYN